MTRLRYLIYRLSYIAVTPKKYIIVTLRRVIINSMKNRELVWVTDECNGSIMCQNCSPEAFTVIDQLAHPIGEVVLEENVITDPDAAEIDQLVLIPKGVELVLIPEGSELEYREAAKECPYAAIITKKVLMVDTVVNSDSPLQSD
jgi:ferredoxin